ncbi:MAG: hypothetical protein EOO51_14210 [Flavobacterium sp.]|nr:MAG: hypothetical protein EOO51_14210 [Flavobacterium sp.]
MRYFYQNYFCLKKIVFLLVAFVGCHSAISQQLHLELTSAVEKERAIIDSIGYIKIHPNAKSITSEVNSLSDKLKKSGWLATEITENTKTNDSTFRYIFSLGKQIKSIRIFIGKNPDAKSIAFRDTKTDTIKLPFSQAESFMNNTLALLENKGYSLAKLKLVDLKQSGQTLYADLDIDIGKPRQVNDIVINGYDKFPEGHKKQIKRLYRNKTFNKQTLEKISADFEKFRFVTQTKYPEILFSKDTTRVFVYLEKTKANRFDGFIGFSNDDDESGKSKIRFNGYLDLLLVNFLNTGEQFTLYWKSDGKKQTTFNAGIELPYIFRSPLGLKANLNIFKQDSTYQNTKTGIALGYFFNYNTRAYLGYESTQSSDIQNQNTSTISDYKNSFVTTSLEYTDYKPDDYLFPEKTRAILRFGLGSRQSKLQSDGQFFADVTLSHNIYLNEKNSINLKSQNFYLNSNNYIVSELYRFGGINSIRGFNENSLQANLLTSLLTEYRYVFAPGLYLHTIADYGFYRDETAVDSDAKSGNLLGLGFGFGLLTKNGLFNLVYANGSSNGQPIKLSNSIVHISFKASF